MSALQIILHRAAEAERFKWGVVARIQSLSEKRSVQEVVAPTDGEVPRSVEVEPGLYSIQLLLPSGEILQEVREVAPGATVRVEFGARPGGDDPVAGAKTRAPRPRRPTAAHPRAKGQRRDGAVFRYLDRAARAPRKHIQAAPVPRAAWLKAAPTMAQLAGMTAVEALALEAEPLGAPAERAGVQCVWRFVGTEGGTVPWLGWCRVETVAAIELVRLPVPWRCALADTTGPEWAPVELRINGEAGLESAASSVEVGDPQLGGLLAYLNRGRLEVVRSLVNALDAEGLITAAIESKMANPLSACAAAYVGLAIFAPEERERWDSWLPNIMTYFPEVPDGPILHARRIQLRPSGPSEISQIAALLAEAHARGTPHFSAGLELMQHLWRSIGRPNAYAKEADAAARVASRVDRDQAFTVLRFPKEGADAA